VCPCVFSEEKQEFSSLPSLNQTFIRSKTSQINIWRKYVDYYAVCIRTRSTEQLTGKHGLIPLTYNMERSNYLVERSDYFVEQSDYYVERSDLEQSDHGTKWPDTAKTLTESVRTLKDFCTQFDLLDAWRVLNPDTRRYTCETFYKHLYSSNNGTQNEWTNDVFFGSQTEKKLNLIDQESCEGLLTKTECWNALKNMECNKTPGTDGYQRNFTKCFGTTLLIYTWNPLTKPAAQDSCQWLKDEASSNLYQKKTPNRI